MKESRFIELLNLYVDQQLSPTEAAELEAEMQRNPNRRATYQQYCRIQKGCTVLFEKERSRAPVRPRLAAALADADRKINADTAYRPSRFGTYLSFGSMAAAACVAAVLYVQRSAVPGASGGSSAIAATVPSAPKATNVSELNAELAQPVTIPAAETRYLDSARPEFYSVLAARRPQSDTQSAISPASETQETLHSSADWMRTLELTPVSNLSEQRFTLTAQPANNPDVRVLRSRKPVDGAATEMTAFQFQR